MEARTRILGAATLTLALAARAPLASAQDAGQGGSTEGSHLANQEANPLADLIRIPLQSNFDFDLGADGDGYQYSLHIQPIIPVSLGAGWLLISRTILPVLYQSGVVDEQGEGGGSVAGLGDTLASLFVSPPVIDGLVVGVGPAVSIPTSTDEQLGPGNAGLGPTAVALWQSHWGSHSVTLGALANHVWSFTDEASDSSQTFLQPFVTYVLPSGTSLIVQSETTFEWHTDTWTVPLIAGVTQVLQLSDFPISVGVFGKWYVAGPDTAPNWGVRAVLTALVPTGGGGPSV